MGDVVFANVFGVEFPVCNEEQKVRLEAAYAGAIEYERNNPDRADGCSCELLIDLLTEGTPRNSVILAAFAVAAVAKDLYEKKAKIAFVLQALQAIEMGSPRGNA